MPLRHYWLHFLNQSPQLFSRNPPKCQKWLWKTGTVKAFEFCYELSWRIMKKVLRFRGADASGETWDIFREAAKLGLLDDAEIWFSYLEKRNITVHTYQKEILDDLFSNTAKEFLKDLDYLLVQLAKEAPKYAPNGK